MEETLRCDAEGCDHIEVVGTITADMIGRPCPKCGANLLTESDWEAWKPYAEMMRVVSQIVPEKSDDPKVKLSAGLHGKKIQIEIEPET